VAVDVLALGPCAANAPLLGALTRASGGSLTLHAGVQGGASLSLSAAISLVQKGSQAAWAAGLLG
jgi:hypothetical protein